MPRKEKRTERVPGKVFLGIEVLPAGWEHASEITSGAYIRPTHGRYKGVPMRPDSALAELLGWPGPCITGHMNVTIQYPDGTKSNLHQRKLKEMKRNGHKA